MTTPTTKPTTQPGQSSDKWMDDRVVVPKWKELIHADSTFQVTFDMLSDLINPLHIAFSIPKEMRRNVRYRYAFNIIEENVLASSIYCAHFKFSEVV